MMSTTIGRSFRLSRGSGDTWLLFVALAFGGVLIFVPAAAVWIMRAGWLVTAFALLWCIQSVRRLVLAGAWTPTSNSVVGTLVALVVLGVWIWCLTRAFIAGKWIDAGIVSIVLAEVVYLEWLKRRNTASKGRGVEMEQARRNG